MLLQIYIYAYTHLDSLKSMRAHTLRQMGVYVRIYTCVPINAWTCSYVCTYICMHIYIYKHIYDPA